MRSRKKGDGVIWPWEFEKTFNEYQSHIRASEIAAGESCSSPGESSQCHNWPDLEYVFQSFDPSRPEITLTQQATVKAMQKMAAELQKQGRKKNRAGKQTARRRPAQRRRNPNPR